MPINGVSRFFTNELTTAPNATPTTMPTARSTTLPRRTNVLKSFRRSLTLCNPPRWRAGSTSSSGTLGTRRSGEDEDENDDEDQGADADVHGGPPSDSVRDVSVPGPLGRQTWPAAGRLPLRKGGNNGPVTAGRRPVIV